MIQCHSNLDAVPRLDIVYKPGRVRDIKVLSYRNVGSVTVGRYDVAVMDIQADSQVCVRAFSRVLYPANGRGGARLYRLVNGLFMRRFLDGYYPLRLEFTVSYPERRLELISVKPGAQLGWNVRHDVGWVFMQGRFEGQLMTQMIFEEKPD